MTATSSEPFSLEQQYPEIAAEWDDEKNVLSKEDIMPGSDKKVWWTCKNNHSWKTSLSYRIKGYGDCLSCKSIAFSYPELMDEWDNDKNNVTPWQVRIGSGKKVWWIGKECGHSWQMEARARIRGNQNCPYCSSQRVLPGFNDLMTTHPEIAKQWNHEKNSKKVTEVTYGLKKKVWWTDECGHSWEMSPLHRTKLKELSCPVCKSVALMHPELMEEWDDKKDPWAISYGSGTKIKWKCLKKESHKWTTSVYARAIAKQGCPYCVNRKVVIGESDVSSTHPHLVQEWDDTKQINEFSYGSNYKAQWKCIKDNSHTWKATINDRSSMRSNCPHCSNFISKAEQEITDYIKSLGFNTERNRKILNRKEIDIYIPESKIAIEYNGVYWHSEQAGKDSKYHYNKWLECKDQGIQLITIWEDDYTKNPGLVKKMLTHKLNASNQEKVYARRTEVQQISIEIAKDFYENNHIQGFKSGHHFGLVEKETGKLVALSTWIKKTKSETASLERFATAYIVPGGFSKLLKYAVNSFKEEGFSQIVTFASHEVSDGRLYENNGFIANKELEPDYSYVIKGRRQHKFGFRLKRFKKDPNLKYIEGYTEKQLAELNGIPKIWDCGKTRYVLNIK